MSRVIIGLSASPGVIVGKVHLLKWELPVVRHRIISDDEIQSELGRFESAVKQAIVRLEHIRTRAAHNAGEEEAAIFDVQLTILADAELLENVRNLIRQNLAAERAFDLVMVDWRQSFARHPHAMLRERVNDLVDVQIRVLSLLMGLDDHDPVDLPKGSNAILVTHDLTPSLTVQLDREAIIGIATDEGTRTSHVAILARSLGLPAVVGLRDATQRVIAGERAILDGSHGILIVDPSDERVAVYQERAVREEAEDAQLRSIASADAVTVDATRITIYTNVDLPEEADQAANSGAEGVGLMRTEFLIVGRASAPDEEEQYRAYSKVIKAFRGETVIIRTFDVGGDKLPIGGFPAEANPFLGWRAIRMCLDQPEFFKVQLRALLRAAVHGNVKIMFPLIVSLDEFRLAKLLLEESKIELTARGVDFNHNVPLGAMIETPAAAISLDTLADEVEFFSIGTNDLVQYTLAVDRGNANLVNRFTPLHPSILRLIKNSVDMANTAGVPIGVCGEMASQPLLAFALIGLGVRQLSVSPRSVGLIKRVIRGIEESTAFEAANNALKAKTASEAENILREALARTFNDPNILTHGLPMDPEEAENLNS